MLLAAHNKHTQIFAYVHFEYVAFKSESSAEITFPSFFFLENIYPFPRPFLLLIDEFTNRNVQ